MIKNKLMALSISIFTLAEENPFIPKLLGLLGEVKGWILAVIGAITVVMIAKEGAAYQHGDGQEKAEAIKNIKKILFMGGGIFFLVWFAAYIVTKMA